MIMSKQSGLGRGLGALIPTKQAASPADASSATPAASQQEAQTPVAAIPVAPKTAVSGPPPKAKTIGSGLIAPLPAEGRPSATDIPVQMIEANPHQPRRHFDHGMMDDLIASVKLHGILQPVLVSRLGGGKFRLIAGERRLRAATLAGLPVIPAVIREASEQEQLELALIENIQRQDLNPIEEAQAYDELHRIFGLTQEDIAKKVGKSRSQISNTLRLLQLPDDMQQALLEGKLSFSNARTLLSIESETERAQLFEAMVASRYTVRQAEDEVQTRRSRPRRHLDPNVRAAEESIRTYLQCKVKIHRKDTGNGEIRLRFYSDEELQAILDKLHQ